MAAIRCSAARIAVDAAPQDRPRAALQEDFRWNDRRQAGWCDDRSLDRCGSRRWPWSRCCCSPAATRPRTARQAQGGAAAARGHGRQAAGAEADRVGRVHRPVRAGAAGRDPGAGAGLPAGDRLRGRPERRGRPGAVRDRPAPLPGGGRPRQGADRARSAPSSTLAQLDQDRTSKLVSTSAAARATLDERNAELAEASASLAGSEAAAAPGRARSRLHPGHRTVRRPDLRPPRRHRQPGQRPDAADHDRPARPDLPHLRHVGVGLPRLPARRRRGASCPRPATTGRSSRRIWSTRTAGRTRAR